MKNTVFTNVLANLSLAYLSRVDDRLLDMFVVVPIHDISVHLAKLVTRSCYLVVMHLLSATEFKLYLCLNMYLWRTGT